VYVERGGPPGGGGGGGYLCPEVGHEVVVISILQTLHLVLIIRDGEIGFR
jgi:hypothetical protein